MLYLTYTLTYHYETWYVSLAPFPEATCQVLGWCHLVVKKYEKIYNYSFSFLEFESLNSFYFFGPTESNGIFSTVKKNHRNTTTNQTSCDWWVWRNPVIAACSYI